jgi:hypothetical protein
VGNIGEQFRYDVTASRFWVLTSLPALYLDAACRVGSQVDDHAGRQRTS